VTVRGKTTYVPVQIGKLVDVAVASRELDAGDVLVASDFSIEARPVEQGAPAAALVGATVTHPVHVGGAIARTDVALAPPLARGTQVALEIRRGAVRVRGTATLEANARPGGPAIVRVAQTRTVVHGVLVAPATVVVGDLP
jgi:flagella basal body P-ring formation protein FlgA